MSFSIPGLQGGQNGMTSNGQADTALLSVQQLLDQVQNGSNHHTPVPPSTTQEISMPEQLPTTQLMQPPPPQIKAEDGNTQALQDGIEIDIPQCLIFGGETGEDEFLIPGRCLQKLPLHALSVLLQDGQRMGAFHRLGSIPHWESMVRLGHFLDHGDYKPFKPATPVEYLDSNGTPQVWNNRDSANAVNIPRATFELFMREIDLYLFAAKLGFSELRRTSAERLCTRYPKSTESIMAMIERTGAAAVANEDRGLLSKIVTYINTNCRELTAMPQFLTLLRKLTRGKPPLGSALLEAYFSSSEALRRELSTKAPVGPRASSTSEAPTPMMTPASGVNSVPPRAASPPLATPPSSSSMQSRFNTPLAASEISNLVEALQRQCLVVANDNGYGTLVKDNARKVRNTDFKFLKGELLVSDRFAEAVNGRHNILVMNSKGEFGDILRTLVKKIPLGMGVLAPEDNSINDGKSTASTARRQDREERTYNPFPTPGARRGRSRSPPPHRGGHAQWHSHR